MVKLQIEGAVNTREQVEFKLARVQRALVVTKNSHLKTESERGVSQEALPIVGEACMKAEEENNRLADERLALVMELGTIMDDFAAFREKAVADRETIEAKLDASGDMLFNYGYGCCDFTHNICRSKPQIQDGMPDPSVPLTPKFFANPRCSPSISSAAQPQIQLLLARSSVRRTSRPLSEWRQLFQLVLRPHRTVGLRMP